MILHLQNYIFQLFIQWFIFSFMFSSLAEECTKTYKIFTSSIQLSTLIDSQQWHSYG